jgi:thioredoxin 1
MSEHVTAVTDATFSDEVLNADTPVLVDFWATWCAPCKAIAPHLEVLAEELQGKVKVVKLDASANMTTARAHKVANLPTFVVFQGGREVSRKVGTAGGIVAVRKLVDGLA